ncbi:hypothetical protein LIER_15439 [Lithospermum erythrorhizon]|uniref:Reverse transcriptase n=1 Tax=Lithospermum erythrorhizon TaxID=34254 RepID=A0AAV3Q3V9_LITER
MSELLPISLCNIVAKMVEGLTCMIREAELRRSLTGIKISRDSPSISHILFADDTIIFCKASSVERAEIMRILRKYEEFQDRRLMWENAP